MSGEPNEMQPWMRAALEAADLRDANKAAQDRQRAEAELMREREVVRNLLGPLNGNEELNFQDGTATAVLPPFRFTGQGSIVWAEWDCAICGQGQLSHQVNDAATLGDMLRTWKEIPCDVCVENASSNEL